MQSNLPSPSTHPPLVSLCFPSPREMECNSASGRRDQVDVEEGKEEKESKCRKGRDGSAQAEEGKGNELRNRKGKGKAMLRMRRKEN